MFCNTCPKGTGCITNYIIFTNYICIAITTSKYKLYILQIKAMF